MESLRFEVEPFGIHTTIVEPGFFRTDLLTKESTAYADLSTEDYAARTAQTRPAWEAMSGKQTNDPAKLARALLTVVDQEQPPLRWVVGADAVAAGGAGLPGDDAEIAIVGRTGRTGIFLNRCLASTTGPCVSSSLGQQCW